MPRPQKYDWEDKRDICYQLYVEQKLSGAQIVRYFAERFSVPESELPAPNQFLARFRLWRFPPRQEKRTAEEEAALLERTRELFNRNLPAYDIHKTLNDEGWTVDEYQFRTLRKKHGLLKRNLNGYRVPDGSSNKRAREGGDGDGDGGENDEEEGADEGAGATEDGAVEQQAELPPLPPEEAARRAQRLTDLQLASDEALRTRKRRRRIRGYGHLPPDAEGMEPRFASETSLDECKAFLQLSNETYVQVRAHFDAICREMGIIKATLCADGQWQASKDRLVRENSHLSAVLHPLQPDVERRLVALNCICSDVTKRMRNQAKAMSIADANNILGLGPLPSKRLRRLLYEVLEADHFTTVVACGKEHLQELCEQWYSQSDLLQHALASGDPQKRRAIDVLNRDARKRYGDDQMKKDPSRKQWQMQKQYGPGPGPAQGRYLAKNGQGLGSVKQVNNAISQQTTSPQKQNPPSRLPITVGPAWAGHEAPDFRMSTIADGPPINFDLDPLLSATTHGPPWPPQAPAPAAIPGPPSAAIPAYFRLASSSDVVGNHPRMWLGKLISGVTLDSLRQAATSKAGSATMTKVHGMVKNADGTEDSWLVENDDELAVYLAEAGEKAVFLVQLEGGYA